MQLVPPAGTREEGPARSEGCHEWSKAQTPPPLFPVPESSGSNSVSRSPTRCPVFRAAVCPLPQRAFPAPEHSTVPPGDAAQAPWPHDSRGGVAFWVSGLRGDHRLPAVQTRVSIRAHWSPALPVPADGLILGAPRVDLGNRHLFPHSWIGVGSEVKWNLPVLT